MLENLSKYIEESKNFFNSKKTLDLDFRLKQLSALESSIIENQNKISEALKLDLNKSSYESFMSEISIVLSEISYAKKNLKKWMKPIKKRVALSQMPGKAKVFYQPLGTVLIISPWNYPFQLTMLPLIAAISAGNTAIIKPSRYSQNTTEIIQKICDDTFNKEYVRVIQGNRDVTNQLLENRFDLVFFTGNSNVGKIIMEKASKNLSPVVLELGGKSPVIVDETSNIKKTAKRILFGKLMNAGQTCVAPDYVFVASKIKTQLLEELKRLYEVMIPNEHYFIDHFPKIIDRAHFDNITKLIEGEKICFGGIIYEDMNKIGFTILDEPNWDSAVMKTEIFAPILPIKTFNNIDEVILKLNEMEKPLALYLFSNDKDIQKRIMQEVSFGGGCINDTLMHIASHHMPFGGVGNSGVGNYHGHQSFKTFSHEKSVLIKSWAMDMNLRYHPYKKPNKKPPEILFKF